MMTRINKVREKVNSLLLSMSDEEERRAAYIHVCFSYTLIRSCLNISFASAAFISRIPFLVRYASFGFVEYAIMWICG